LCTLVACILFSCEYLPLTNEEVIDGLKQALTIGAETASTSASVENGFWGNDLIRIPLPPEAQAVKNTLDALQNPILLGVLQLAGFNAQMVDFERSLNRAAERAAVGAFNIFAGAVREMTIADGFAILNGGETAATDYLREKTTVPLKASFSPIIIAAIAEVEVITQFWNPIINTYNNVNSAIATLPPILGISPLGDPVNPDLEEFITDKAIDGLMKLIAEQEKKIRTDPLEQVTPLLRRVFGGSK
jgi:hypothetical protein